MKKICLLISLATCSLLVNAQSRYPPLDKSPMDMSYYPVNYPILKIQEKNTDPLIARIVYSRPQKNGRTVFGELVEYGQVWRMGANEATELEFFRDVKIDSKKIKKGRYTLYALVTPEKWIFILNRDTDIWGAFKYDQAKDIVRTTVPVQKQPDSSDVFSIIFEKNANGPGADLLINWDDVLVKLPFTW